MKAQLDNKKKLQQLYLFDEKMKLLKSAIEQRKEQIDDLKKEAK